MSQVREDTIPDDMSTLVFEAASALPSGDYGLDRVVGRRRSHRRRTVTTLSLLSIVVMAAATAIPLAFRATLADPAGTAAESPQRLYYYRSDGSGDKAVTLDSVISLDEPKIGIQISAGITELDEDGTRVRHIGLGRWATQSSVIGLPDGGLVVAGARDPRPDGERVTELVHFLSVFAPDGTERIGRNLGDLDGPSVDLVGATGDDAYLMRDKRLVRHDLATGEEKPASAAKRVGQLLAQGWTVDSVVSDRILLIKYDPDGGGRLIVLNRSGKQERDAPLGCAMRPDWTVGLKLSPDGRHFACYAVSPTPVWGREAKSELVITDLSTSRPALRRELPPNYMAAFATAVAWTGNDTLQLAHFWLPPGQSGSFDLLDLVRVETLTL